MLFQFCLERFYRFKGQTELPVFVGPFRIRFPEAVPFRQGDALKAADKGLLFCPDTGTHVLTGFFFFPFQIMLISKGIIEDGLLIKNEQGFGYLPDKIPVMRDEEQGSCIGAESRFQRLFGRNIHMVGGFIQHQEIRAALQ